MSNQLVSEAEVEKALDFLRDSAADIGAAKAQAIKCDRMVGHIEAVSMKHSGESAVAAQKREARASKRYLDAIEKEAVAVAEFERLKALREAATAKIQTWQTQSANYRSMKL